ncbi:uncharacterized protein B0H64DRAFT_190216 [Chaetomium fimeti]|jgi:hypothetical protein|uniref:Uncharacterized protein n=1 Tax=Chaetomium fimeti TaxID=1854472 RepID=A0AAE0LRG5_9PEZI|nr:hypothetical protein B0H64DRAFT_190216 [Chaetomium fimeti]
MDFLNKVANQATGKQGDKPQEQQSSSGGGFMDKLNGLAGGGAAGEKKEDALDKGIDWMQEKVFKQGAQNNESAAEQAKDRMIAQQIRDQYKKATGKDFPIKEEEKKQAEKNGFGGLF